MSDPLMCPLRSGAGDKICVPYCAWYMADAGGRGCSIPRIAVYLKSLYGIVDSLDELNRHLEADPDA